jgi:predicted O-methyltransferase YrrM
MDFSKYNTIHGWCTIEKANKLIEIVNTQKPSLCVELGVFGGRSLLPLAWASKNLNQHAKVIGIDAWDPVVCTEGENDKTNDDWWVNINHTDMLNYTIKLMQEYKVDDIVQLWKSKSVDVADKFTDNSIDILHQDSNHSEVVTCNEVELYWNKVKSNGIWIFDDANWPTTFKAQELLVSKGYTEIYKYEAHGTGWKIFKRTD